MLTFKNDYDKSKFYSLMGKFFAEREYKRLMPYLANDKDTIWNVKEINNEVFGFIGYKEDCKNTKIVYCFVEEGYKSHKALQLKLLNSIIKDKDVYIELEKWFDKSIYEKLGFKVYKETKNYLYLELIKK